MSDPGNAHLVAGLDAGGADGVDGGVDPGLGGTADPSLTEGRFRHVVWVDELDSTNTRLLDAARRGADDGTVLVADHQTAGRGRLGRVWEAPPQSSLLVSVLIRPGAVDVGELSQFTMAAGVAMAEACGRVAGLEPALKWPNDLLDPIRGLKLGGMLSEVVWAPASGAPIPAAGAARPEAIVIGVGLNVNWPEVIPGDLAEIATSLRHLTGGPVDRRALLVAFLGRIGHWLDDRGSHLAAAYRSRLSTLGQQVRVETATGVVEGLAHDLTDDGRLLVRDGTGDHLIVAGDVVHLRPT